MLLLLCLFLLCLCTVLTVRVERFVRSPTYYKLLTTISFFSQPSLPLMSLPSTLILFTTSTTTDHDCVSSSLVQCTIRDGICALARVVYEFCRPAHGRQSQFHGNLQHCFVQSFGTLPTSVYYLHGHAHCDSHRRVAGILCLRLLRQGQVTAGQAISHRQSK